MNSHRTLVIGLLLILSNGSLLNAYPSHITITNGSNKTMFLKISSMSHAQDRFKLSAHEKKTYTNEDITEIAATDNGYDFETQSQSLYYVPVVTFTPQDSGTRIVSYDGKQWKTTQPYTELIQLAAAKATATFASTRAWFSSTWESIKTRFNNLFTGFSPFTRSTPPTSEKGNNVYIVIHNKSSHTIFSASGLQNPVTKIMPGDLFGMPNNTNSVILQDNNNHIIHTIDLKPYLQDVSPALLKQTPHILVIEIMNSSDKKQEFMYKTPVLMTANEWQERKQTPGKPTPVSQPVPAQPHIKIVNNSNTWIAFGIKPKTRNEDPYVYIAPGNTTQNYPFTILTPERTSVYTGRMDIHNNFEAIEGFDYNTKRIQQDAQRHGDDQLTITVRGQDGNNLYISHEWATPLNQTLIIENHSGIDVTCSIDTRRALPIRAGRSLAFPLLTLATTNSITVEAYPTRATLDLTRYLQQAASHKNSILYVEITPPVAPNQTFGGKEPRWIPEAEWEKQRPSRPLTPAVSDVPTPSNPTAYEIEQPVQYYDPAQFAPSAPPLE